MKPSIELHMTIEHELLRQLLGGWTVSIDNVVDGKQLHLKLGDINMAEVARIASRQAHLANDTNQTDVVPHID